MKIQVCILISCLCFFFSTSIFAFEGHNGGGVHPVVNHGYHTNNYRNGGNYHDHGRGYYDHYYHNNVWYGGTTWDEGAWYDDGIDDNTNVVLGVPAPGYYDPTCQIIDNCSTGTCVLVNTCDQY